LALIREHAVKQRSDHYRFFLIVCVQPAVRLISTRLPREYINQQQSDDVGVYVVYSYRSSVAVDPEYSYYIPILLKLLI